MAKHDDLILREPEYAALLGEVDADFGAPFNPDPFADLSEAAPDFGWDDDYGAEAAAPVAAQAEHRAAQLMQHPAHQARAHAIIAKHLHREMMEKTSQQRLNPNEGNAKPTYRWAFSVTGSIASVGTKTTGDLGGASGLSQAPNIGVFNPDTLTVNVPQPNFVLISDIKVLSQSLLVGGAGDAYKYNPISTSKRLNSVPLNPAIPVVILSSYTGMPIIGSTYTGAYTMDFNFEGWSSPTGMLVVVTQ